jgi:hypothetical protein
VQARRRAQRAPGHRGASCESRAWRARNRDRDFDVSRPDRAIADLRERGRGALRATVPNRSMRRTLAALALIAALAGPAAAEDKRSGWMVWGATGLEVGCVGVFAIAFGTNAYASSWVATPLALAPFALGAGTAYLAHRADLGPTGPIVAHGAAWTGLDLFMLGTLIDGRNDRYRMKIGPTSIALGIAGTLGGGYLASRSRTGTADSVWLGAAPGGFIAGGLALGGLLVLAGGLDGDKASSQFATGAVAGLSIGLGAAIYYTMTQQGPRASGTQALRMPSIEIVAERTVISYGGAF